MQSSRRHTANSVGPMPDLISEREEHVATITLNRPDRMNAISGDMLIDLSAALLDADRDPAVRVIVLTGKGRAFCAGLDLVDASEGKGLGPAIGRRPGELDVRDAPPVVLHKMDTPTIASLNGGAAGYGFDLAMGCDLRVAADSAKLAAVFTRRGLVPESGGTW
ncbi:MAG: enoyl-CoA hydratase/isomerase family protein, partial [Actinobacteria bacterium]|nr:enoyl-CoA hydratase/isomerase family protein [Actinomycetota bacterium]